MIPTPRIAMPVVFNHPGSADGLHPRKQSPALIQRVNEDDTLELVVFSVYGGLFFNHNVRYGPNEPSCWCWPTEAGNFSNE